MWTAREEGPKSYHEKFEDFSTPLPVSEWLPMRGETVAIMQGGSGWYWRIRDGRARGPFGSRNEAAADAKRLLVDLG